MENAKKPFYRYCAVPKCKNTIRKTPDKLFFPVPRKENIRKQWCKAMRRKYGSSTSSLYCCEDHFNVVEDTTNYIQYNIMKQEGEKVLLMLKKGVVPYIFKYQNRNKKGVIRRQKRNNKQTLKNKANPKFGGKSNAEIVRKYKTDIYEPSSMEPSHAKSSDELVLTNKALLEYTVNNNAEIKREIEIYESKPFMEPPHTTTTTDTLILKNEVLFYAGTGSLEIKREFETDIYEPPQAQMTDKLSQTLEAFSEYVVSSSAEIKREFKTEIYEPPFMEPPQAKTTDKLAKANEALSELAVAQIKTEIYE